MSLFRWRDPSFLHTLNFVRGIRTGANKVANNPRQRNRLRRQAEFRSSARTHESRFSPSRLRQGKNFRAEAAQHPNQKLTSYGEYMQMMASLHEKQMKLEEDMARAEIALKKEKEREEHEKDEQANKAPFILVRIPTQKKTHRNQFDKCMVHLLRIMFLSLKTLSEKNERNFFG